MNLTTSTDTPHPTPARPKKKPLIPAHNYDPSAVVFVIETENAIYAANDPSSASRIHQKSGNPSPVVYAGLRRG